jgi:uncharacterized BrkB/YihY/UPF0761 family membrane protein
MSATRRQWFGHVWTFLQSVAEKFLADKGFFYTSAVAFNLLLYFVPLSLLIVSLLGYTVLDSERAMNEVRSVLQAFLPQSQLALAENLAAVVAEAFWVLSGSFRSSCSVVFSSGLSESCSIRCFVRSRLAHSSEGSGSMCS